MATKVCPVITRTEGGATEVLAFRHPTAGKQFVKGGANAGETAFCAAVRELEEESGIATTSDFLDIGEAPIGATVWHFFISKVTGLPDRWSHQTHDDHGHRFSFFWHPLCEDLDDDWDTQFHEALEVIRQALAR